jgi:methionyl aminopeptidase
MSIEHPEDLQGMRRAGRLVAETIAAMRVAVRSGVTTAALDAIGASVIEQAGGRSAPKLVYRFPGVTCISVNDEAVHGVPGPRILRDGDLVTLDVTVELDGYMGDAAVTVPVGRVSSDAARLVDAAEGAFTAALAAASPGARLCDLGGIIEAHVEQAGFKVLRDLCGHGIGRTIHEPPNVLNFADPRVTGRLTDGLVITIEPIIAAGTRRTRGSDRAWPIRSADGSLTAHHEHTIVVRSGGCEILTALAA